MKKKRNPGRHACVGTVPKPPVAIKSFANICYLALRLLVFGAYELNRTYAISLTVVIRNLHVISVAD